MSFAVNVSLEAEDDLNRLFDCLLDKAETAEDLDAAQAAIEAIRATVCGHLADTPYGSSGKRTITDSADELS